MGTITSTSRPKVVAAGQPALDVGVERYIVKGGGSAVFALDKDDTVEIALLEGGQPVEIAVFSRDGRSDLPALGLKGHAKPAGIHRILSGDSEDAAPRPVRSLPPRARYRPRQRRQAVRQRRAGGRNRDAEDRARHRRRHCGTRRADARLGPDSADRHPSIHPPRQASPPGETRSPEPLAEPRLDIRINIASAESFEVFEGEYIQIIDVAGRQCSDFLAFHRRALDKGNVLGLDSTTTRSMTGLAYPKPGLFSKFFDRDRNPLVEVVQDTVGRHDTFDLACTTRFYEDMGYFGHANCSDNFNNALAPYDVGNTAAGRRSTSSTTPTSTPITTSGPTNPGRGPATTC